MSRKAQQLLCSEGERKVLEEWARCRTLEARMVERAKIILGCLDETPIVEIARELNIRPNTVIDWRKRFQDVGIDGLYDLPRSGKPPIYGEEYRKKVLATLELPPPAGQAVWDAPAISKMINGSTDAVWRILRKEGSA